MLRLPLRWISPATLILTPGIGVGADWNILWVLHSTCQLNHLPMEYWEYCTCCTLQLHDLEVSRPTPSTCTLNASLACTVRRRPAESTFPPATVLECYSGSSLMLTRNAMTGNSYPPLSPKLPYHERKAVMLSLPNNWQYQINNIWNEPPLVLPCSTTIRRPQGCQE